MVDPTCNFCRAKFHPEIRMDSPLVGASNRGEVGKTSHFLALNVNIWKAVGDTSKVTVGDYTKKLNMHFPLAPRMMTLDDLELL